jgi:hypothetical protein
MTLGTPLDHQSFGRLASAVMCSTPDTSGKFLQHSVVIR